MRSPVMLDVRTIAPRERHPLIFRHLATLPVSGELQIINDHDPKPLYYQIMAEYPGQFAWEYLESGPDVWRVKVTRQAE